jgi:transcriptional regulator with GAF, ATPase, and Fis domain
MDTELRVVRMDTACMLRGAEPFVPNVDIEGGERATAFGSIVGTSPALRTVLLQVELVASTDATVLICGESGTGKELVAREIHQRSARAHRPLVNVNCSSVPRELFESEFFGHARGSFTGALHERRGRFQLAHGGTIFLDEVGDLALDLQPKVLRVLQERQYERVGDDVPRQVDVRVIAATNRDLTSEIRAGRFRQDLYYRLTVFPIDLPPLRMRRADIPLLAAHFVTRAARKLGITAPQLTRRQVEQFQAYDWPGNIRELENVIERAMILSRTGRPELDVALPHRANGDTCPPATGWTLPLPDEIVPDVEWRRRERANIVAALQRAGGRI